MESPQSEYFVLEISSYQLESSTRFHPKVGAILNVTADHLARHATIEQYAGTKAKLFARQTADEFAIANADDPVCAPLSDAGRGKALSFSLNRDVPAGLWVDGDVVREGEAEVAKVSDVPLPGKHNLANAVAALTAVRAAGLEWAGCLAGLRAFEAVEHRIEPVTTFEGVDYVNDSKSTNVDSLRVALESFERPIVLIAGGRGKGSDYRVLRELVQRHVKAMVTSGEDAPALESAFGDIVKTVRADDMDAAVWKAHEQAARGDVVLLSPGCARFDWFAIFEERGRVFKQAVARLTGPQQLAAWGRRSRGARTWR
jgi:UDP-N-acetylmuramoylalanine--D-glutamate ligase